MQKFLDQYKFPDCPECDLLDDCSNSECSECLESYNDKCLECNCKVLCDYIEYQTKIKIDWKVMRNIAKLKGVVLKNTLSLISNRYFSGEDFGKYNLNFEICRDIDEYLGNLNTNIKHGSYWKAAYPHLPSGLFTCKIHD